MTTIINRGALYMHIGLRPVKGIAGSTFGADLMPSRSFTTRRQWHNTLLMVWVTPFLILFAILLLAIYGNFWGVLGAGSVILIGLMIALARDLGDRCYYSFRNNRIILETHRSRREIPVEEIIDASLIDRMAAREYLRGRIAEREGITKKERKRMIQEFVRYCTVDIGFTSLTLGLGRSVIDRLPLAKYDLVLLRLKGEEDHLLSPKYNQDLVDTVSRMIMSRPTPDH